MDDATDGKEEDGWEPTAHIRWIKRRRSDSRDLQQMFENRRLGVTEWRDVLTFLSGSFDQDQQD